MPSLRVIATVSLLVVDAATGVIFTRTEPFPYDRQHREAPEQLEVAVAEARLRLQGHGDEHARRVEIRIPDRWPGGIGRMAQKTTEGQTELSLFLPPLPVELRVLGGTGNDSPYAPVPILGSKAIEPVAGERLATSLEWGR
jgi:hypothetical protein